MGALPKPDPAEEEWIWNAKKLAYLLGITDRRITQLVTDGMPKHGRGKFHAPTVVQWFLGQHKQNKARDINQQRQMLYKAQTDKTELENRITRGELLRAEAVQTAIFSIGTEISTHLQAIEPRLARQFSEEQREALKHEIDSTQEAIANAIKAFADNRDSSGDYPATA